MSLSGVLDHLIKLKDTRKSFIILGRGLTRFAFYLLTLWIVRIIFLTALTYRMQYSRSSLQDIGEKYALSEMFVAGFSALIYVLLSSTSNPRYLITRKDLLPTRPWFKRFFVSSFGKGFILAFGLVFLLIQTGLFSYLGIYLELYLSIAVITEAVLRILGLFLLIHFEEFIFRKKIQSDFVSVLGPWAGVFLTSALYMLMKMIQFDLLNLSLNHILSLFLISIYLGLQMLKTQDFMRGSGFWLGILFLFHLVSGLPVFGNEFQSPFLIRYHDPSAHLSGIFSFIGESLTPNSASFFTGGQEGPLSGILFICIVTIYILKNMHEMSFWSNAVRYMSAKKRKTH